MIRYMLKIVVLKNVPLLNLQQTKFYRSERFPKSPLLNTLLLVGIG